MNFAQHSKNLSFALSLPSEKHSFIVGHEFNRLFRIDKNPRDNEFAKNNETKYPKAHL